jgi:hypothetical protein
LTSFPSFLGIETEQEFINRRNKIRGDFQVAAMIEIRYHKHQETIRLESGDFQLSLLSALQQ